MFPQVMLSYFVTPLLLTVMNSNYLYCAVHSCQFSATLQGVTLAILQMMYLKVKHIFSVILDTVRVAEKSSRLKLAISSTKK